MTVCALCAVTVPSLADVHGVQDVVSLQRIDLGVGDDHGWSLLHVGDARGVGAEVLAPVDHGHRRGDVAQRQGPVDGAVPAADDHHVLPGVRAEFLDHVVQAAALPLGPAGQWARGERADAAGDDHRAAGDPGAPVGGDQQPIARARALPRAVGERHGLLTEHVDRLEAGGLLHEPGDEVATLDAREAGDVVDHLLGVQRGHLSAGLGQAVHDRRSQPPEPCVVGGVQPGRSRRRRRAGRRGPPGRRRTAARAARRRWRS